MPDTVAGQSRALWLSRIALAVGPIIVIVDLLIQAGLGLNPLTRRLLAGATMSAGSLGDVRGARHAG